jgi:two-component system response regulator AlgR
VSEPLSILIIDDEPIAANRLRLLCEEMAGVRVIALAGDGHDGLRQITDLAPDLVLLDIAMPGLDGLALARMLGTLAAPPAIVFCTAYDRHALAAFDVSAVDYLLKPISRERLARAIGKAARHHHPPPDPDTSRPAWIDHVWVSHRGAMHRVAIADVERIDAEGDYLRLSTPGNSYLLHETMSAIEGRLDPGLFLRLRRSVIVRSSMIASIRHEGMGIWSALLAPGTSIRIGPTHLKRVKERLLG